MVRLFPLPEVQRYGHLCYVASTPDEFVTAIERALAQTGPVARGARSAVMRGETWAARVAEVTRTIDSIAERKRTTR